MIETLKVAKSLGILFDEHLTFVNQINAVIKSSKLNFELKKQLIYCLIFSKIDYCNELFTGLPDYAVIKLQKVQNACVRFLFGKRISYRDHVTPFLKEAHFLPVQQRIDFKIALFTYKCINNIAPNYLKKLIALKEQLSISLRDEQDYFLLDIPKYLLMYTLKILNGPLTKMLR